MADLPAARRATQPQRRFSPDDLAGLDRDERRKLTQLLLTETGSRVVKVHRPVAYDELVLETRPLWRPRRVRVRVADRPVDAGDVERLGEAVAAAGDAEGVLVAACGATDGLAVPSTVMLVLPEELIARMERCSVIAWPDRHPTPAYDRLSAQRDLDRDAFLLDPVGLRWLPALALNELPVELTGSALVPDAIFERLAFRLLTTALRFGGVRYGESARGQRLPDAVLAWPGPSRLLALMDCKAAATLSAKVHGRRAQRSRLGSTGTKVAPTFLGTPVSRPRAPGFRRSNRSRRSSGRCTRRARRPLGLD